MAKTPKFRPASSSSSLTKPRHVKRKPASARAAVPQKQRASSKAAVAEEEWTYDRLWDDKEVSNGWHMRNVRFWKTQGTNVHGMTGGGVSQKDLAFSAKALSDLSTGHVDSSESGQRRWGRALDCGAGIGRVTNGVLKHFCSHVDMVEFVKKHLQKARATLQSTKACSFDYHNLSMQRFTIQPGKYDLIWCQWLLMYLTDSDSLDLLKRSCVGLAGKGILLVKENVSTVDKSTYFDDEHGELWMPGEVGRPVSCVRTCPHYEDLFERAGLRLIGERHQTDLGDGCMEMCLWLLEPTERQEGLAFGTDACFQWSAGSA